MMNLPNHIGDGMQQCVLATDLDGTLIPLPDQHDHIRDLQLLGGLIRQHQIPLIYVTGRHLSSVKDAIREHGLPQPNWVFCDVGTSAYARMSHGEYRLDETYAASLDRITGHAGRDELLRLCEGYPTLCLQESEKQGRFKLSFYIDASQVDIVALDLQARLTLDAMPFVVVHSVDPFNNAGLIDILPAGVSKAFALHWWREQHCFNSDQILFAGDSGNDLAAFTAGFRAIMVNNTPAAIVQQVQEWHHGQQSIARPFYANATATSGVLQGLIHFMSVSRH